MNKFMIGLIVGLCLSLFMLEPKEEPQDSFDVGDNVLVNMDDGVQKGIIVSEINTQAKVRVYNNEYVVSKENLVEY